MSETELKQEASNSLPGNTIICPRCAASRVAKSRLRQMDRVRMQFFPVRPYRCLHCYHRFWAKERFAAEKKRIWSWVAILIAILIWFLFFFVRTPEQSDSGEGQATSNGQQIDGQIVAPESVIQPVIEQPTADPEELAAVSVRLEEYGWYVTETGEEQPPIETAEPQSESTLNVGGSVQELDQSSPEVTIEERESLLKVTIARRMKQWRTAWESGDADAYLANYSDNFVPTNWQTLEQWRAVRIDRVNPQKKIELALSEFDVSFSDEYQKVAVKFNQRYQSSTYLDNSVKRIEWAKEGDLWRIVSEREIE